MTPAVRRALPAAVIAMVVALAAWWVIPSASRQPLRETTVWTLLVMCAFAGWGSLVRFAVARRAPVDLGLRIAWGASALAFLGATLMTFSAMTRPVALVMVESGILLTFASLYLERAAVRARLRVWHRAARAEPGIALMTALVVFLVVVQLLGAVSEWHTNPYDDDIAYLAFAKKLSDTGAFPEPFSFRRLSALGGQTFFHELFLVRASPRQSNAFDRGACVVLIALLLAGHRTRGRRPSWLFASGAIMLVLLVENVGINTASYYSGIAFFLALFRTIAWLGDRREISPVRAAAPVALVAAVTCTLRQNFLPVPVIMLAASYAFRLRAAGWNKKQLLEPLAVMGLTFVALAPWLVGAYQSNGTFLYPLQLGTFNKALQLKASGFTFVREIRLVVWTALEGIPLHTFWLFALAIAFVREKDPRRPLWSFAIASGIGFLFLVHTLTQGDAGNIGRYAYGFLAALALAALVTVGTVRFRKPPLRRLHVAAAIAILAAFVQIVESRQKAYRGYERAFRTIDELNNQITRAPFTSPPEELLYERLQRSVPAGARLGVLLDEPHYLDFARNPIWNFDMPGYSSLPPGMPFFQGSEKLEAYFKGLGVRYVAFVKPEYSRYHYRRDYWVELVGNEMEIWRAFAPYLLSFIDSMVEISTRHKALFDESGMIVLDLEQAP
jgi:hypothetical protein